MEMLKNIRRLFAMVALSWALAVGQEVAVATEAGFDSWIADLEGGWAGDDNVTPFGRMGFAMLFEWQEDGSLRSHSALNTETYIDLRFVKQADGSWYLQEEGGMEGLGVQSHTLVPAEGPDGLKRWVYAEDPEYLSIDVGVDRDLLSMDVRLRGRDHVQFRLARLPDQALPELKRQMTAAARTRPEDGVSIHQARGGSNVPAAITAARRAVAAEPADAGARLQLARALGEAIQRDMAANGARYAGEMLGSLQTAIELDPSLSEAYHWLAGYYLNAPAIAGGSVAKAEEVARSLAEFDPEGAESLLADVAAHRAAHPGSR